MGMITAAEFAKKWASRTSAASQDYQAGIDRVTTAPGQQAAAAADLWQAKLNDPNTKDKYRRRVASVGLAEWQTQAKTKGAQRLASGAQAAAPKAEQFAAKFLPYMANGVAQVKQMPKLTVEDGINRAAAMIRHNAGYKG